MRKKGVYLVFLGIVFKSEMCCSYLNKGLGEIFPRVICFTEPQKRWDRKLAFFFPQGRRDKIIEYKLRALSPGLAKELIMSEQSSEIVF